MDYQQALDYLYSFIDFETLAVPRDPSNYDLRRMDELLARLDNPHLGAKSVHIAGTNGKGSTGAMVASALAASGYTTGFYTSPHLNDLRERIRVNDELISEERLIALVEKLQPEVEVVNQKATYGKLTTFEVLTALGFTYFNQKGVEIQVLEAGLGGRLDATNVVLPEVSIITSIGFDHMVELGSTLAEITMEKAGIIKPGGTVVTSPQHDEADQVIAETCINQGARLIRVGSDVTWQELDFAMDKQSLQVKGRLGSYKLSIPLLGHYQLVNTATAVAALEVLVEKGLNISRDNIIDGLARVSWPGRFQVLSHHPFLVVDGAMNIDGARRLKESLGQYFGLYARGDLKGHATLKTTDSRSTVRKFDRAILIIGASFDKDIANVVAELFPLFDEIIITRSRHPRAMATEPIVAEFAGHGVDAKVTDDVPSALSLAWEIAGTEDIICVAGSLFVVGEVIEQTDRQAKRSKGN